jgi:hypothetical protein
MSLWTVYLVSNPQQCNKLWTNGRDTNNVLRSMIGRYLLIDNKEIDQHPEALVDVGGLSTQVLSQKLWNCASEGTLKLSPVD